MQHASDEIVLSVNHVKKKIGRKWIIKDVTFDIRAGEVFGFLGPNGAGKTTTIRMLVDLIKPTEGVIKVCGYNVNTQQEQALQYVGSIVENPEMYSYLTGWENLEHFARMQPGVDAARIAEVVDIVGMDKRIHDKVRTYSLGMRQRLGIAQALLGRPRLLILDEPTNGLDPKGIKEMRQFIHRLAAEGLAVFVSSHLLSEIQLLCDRVAIISRGSVLAVGGVQELIAGSSGYVIWHVSSQAEAQSILSTVEGCEIIEKPGEVLDDSVLAGMGQKALVTILSEDMTPLAVRKLMEAGIGVFGVSRINPTLEQLFLQMTEGESIE
ncbi:putative bacitracin ABC transporter, ATP-binding protein BcrA [Paenibacillus algicola]|uniref:Putative bacitracin ABC transporter, ATP-binding protein BcrA n=1 Tax=Paenibacillus algicola TaxID=2565926 RepID=A0A4P8XMA5_9BACL|nr:ABC transporter ATP-binding protein [Paenibacillus algicola]QCT02641.1 putative bacitracin ABC transporter, ATP-binding protein BcrA [Paenibacillus algicola]